MIADPRPLESLVSGQPMDVIPLETIVNIEAIINDAQYPEAELMTTPLPSKMRNAECGMRNEHMHF